MNFGNETGLIPGIGLGLVLFGIFFNWFTSWSHERGFSEGYTWLLVVLGVAITVVAGGPVVGWDNVLLTLFFFACSGLPMAAGDIWRHVKALKEFEQRHNGKDGH